MSTKSTPEPRKKANVRRPLMEIFVKRVGQTLFVNDLAHELGVTEDQIRNAIAGIRHDHPHLHVEAVVPGRGYASRPNKAAVPAQAEAPVSGPPAKQSVLFSLMGTRKNGNLILEREDGTLWEATEL